MAIYGDMLAFFPEQFRMFDYFSMSTNVVAGYSNRKSLGKVKAVMQYLKRGELMSENDTLSDVDVPTLWTKQKLDLGNFIDIEGDVYKITNDTKWKFQGDFIIYILETVSGNTDEQTEDEDVDLGQFSYR